ncbi:hypothetical protein [Hymenobacter daeguensis]
MALDSTPPVFTVGVYRTDCNNLLAPPNSPEAWCYHRRRAQALHELFDADPTVNVASWGQTDDQAQTHEYVEMAMQLVAHPPVSAAATAALGFVGAALGSAATDLVKDGLKYLVKKLWEKNAPAEKFQEVVIHTGGVQVVCRVESTGLKVHIHHAGGSAQAVYPPSTPPAPARPED